MGVLSEMVSFVCTKTCRLRAQKIDFKWQMAVQKRGLMNMKHKRLDFVLEFMVYMRSIYWSTSTAWFSPGYYCPLSDSLICGEYIFSWAMPTEAKHDSPLAEKWLFNTSISSTFHLPTLDFNSIYSELSSRCLVELYWMILTLLWVIMFDKLYMTNSQGILEPKAHKYWLQLWVRYKFSSWCIYCTSQEQFCVLV